jgi:geranylgeranyl pyrophosphate synthase
MDTKTLAERHRNTIRSEETFEEVSAKVERLVYPTILNAIEPRFIDSYPEIREMVTDYTKRKGRYIRPKLLWIFAKMFGAPDSAILVPASAIQLSEDFVLQIDDMTDGTEVRRGKPAFHKVYGFNNTFITPQLLISSMWNMLHEYAMNNGAIGISVYKKVIEFSDITFIGQALENMFKPRQTSAYPKTYIKALKGIGEATYDDYFEIVTKKTAAYTIYGPAIIGAMIGGASKKQLELIERIGTKFGIAFQINDDIEDYLYDIKEGQPTIVTIHTYASCTDDEKRLMARVFSKLPDEKSTGDIANISSLVDKYGSLDYAKAQFHTNMSEGLKAYQGNSFELPDNEYTMMVFKLFSDFVGSQKA